MDDLVARRRRAWFGLILVVAFVLLGVAALLPSPSGPIHGDQAGADETVPIGDVSATVPTTAPVTTTTRVKRTPTTTESPGTTEAPTTTTTAPAAKKTSATPIAAAPNKAPTPTPVTAPSPSASAADFLACIRMRESHNNYTTVSASGNYRGAYQFNQPAWDSTAHHAGREDLVGQLANLVSPADQDALALDLYLWQGSRPWGGACD